MFKSSLAKEINNYLSLRFETVTLSTAKFDESVLKSIDIFMLTNKYRKKYLTEDIVNQWISTLTGKSKTVNEKIGVIRNFSKYLNSLGHTSFIPSQIKVKSEYIPYIYSDQEIKAIFHNADNLECRIKNNITLIEIPMLIRILYGCGTRLGETLELKRKNIDFENSTIFLVKTKNSKERLIPMHVTLANILKQYCITINIINQPEAYLFPSRHKSKEHLSKRQANIWFNKILKLSNIDKQNLVNTNVRLHDFRHLFVLKSMQQLEERGHSVDMNDLLLPTYLGHECLIDTDKYMKFSGVQINNVIEKFENFTSNLFTNVEVYYDEE